MGQIIVETYGGMLEEQKRHQPLKFLMVREKNLRISICTTS